MSDAQASSSQASSAPRGNRRGRTRGPRQGRQGNGTRSTAAESSQQSQTATAPGASGSTAVSSEAGRQPGSQDQPRPAPRGGRGGRDRGRRGRGGRSANQLSAVVTQRAFGGRLTSDQGGEASPEATLSGNAPEFVPGRPVALRRPRPSQPQGPVPESSSSSKSAAPTKPPLQPRLRRGSKSSAVDLPTRIHEDIDNGQYECVICTYEVVRTSRIWSCSICWTVAHLHCVKKWHTNQLKNRDQSQPQNPDQPLGWRCPGCNSSLQGEPGSHHCWCGKEINPKSVPGLTPHSCAQTCSKPRTTCPHTCPLMCHAGPCPPCTLMGPTQTCYCGKNISTKRCTETTYGQGWSCEELCGDLLPCGEHTCSRPCHSGLCGGCEVPIPSICYCGKERRDIPCDRRDTICDSFDYGQLETSALAEETKASTPWFEGSFECKKNCGRQYDCGHHVCERSCHPQDEQAAHCPLSPDVISHCPCGKTPLEDVSEQPRQSCRDPVPHCDKACSKALSCGHHCLDRCHTGPCKPCFQTIDIACGCGRTTTKSVCHQGNIQRPQCFRVCRAQLSCGRHECGEHCCPGEKKAMERRRQKRNANGDFEVEHICLQSCGRTLKCGKHACQQLCHKGACPSCLEAVFDEISCSCGKTVLQPPQPCGTRPPECRFDCTKPRPCGHPIVSHQCHPDDTSCPKCPFLVEKLCICGKKTLKNQPCWFGDARCGLPCGNKLKCGAHECKELCHRPGECEDVGISVSHCSQACGKVRKSCDHTCIEQCHAPYPCKEDKPCSSKTFITCPCQRRKQQTKCLATRANPWPTRHPLKCDDECLTLQRNRRLAEALHIDPDTHTNDHIPYSDTTLKLFKESLEWAQAREREFRVFAADPEEKRVRFKPMPAHQRAFMHALAEDFGLDSESQDPEPHRHVCVFKTPRFVSAPRKTLAQCLRLARTAAINAAATSSLRPAATTGQQPFNAFLLTSPRFGLTIEEVDNALAADIAAAGGPSLRFVTSFLPSDEIVVRSTPLTTTAANIAASLTPTPQAVEAAVMSLKPAIARTVARLGIAGSVTPCHADASLAILRREGDAAATGGWSTVAGKGTWRRTAPSSAATPAGEKRAPSSFLALRKIAVEPRKEPKGKEAEAIEEDWFAAVEKLDEDMAKAEAEAEAEAEGDAVEDTGSDGAADVVEDTGSDGAAGVVKGAEGAADAGKGVEDGVELGVEERSPGLIIQA